MAHIIIHELYEFPHTQKKENALVLEIMNLNCYCLYGRLVALQSRSRLRDDI